MPCLIVSICLGLSSKKYKCGGSSATKDAVTPQSRAREASPRPNLHSAGPTGRKALKAKFALHSTIGDQDINLISIQEQTIVLLKNNHYSISTIAHAINSWSVRTSLEVIRIFQLVCL